METCKFCGSVIGEGYWECEGIAKWREDPFMLEIHDEIVMGWLCDGQYRELMWEI